MVGVGRDFKDHLPWVGHLSLELEFQSLIQPGLEWFEGWGIQNFSEHLVPVPQTLRGRIFFSIFNPNLPSSCVRAFPLVLSQHALVNRLSQNNVQKHIMEAEQY